MASSMECVICMEEYNNPVVLPCGHTFCLKCIQGCVNYCRVSCPECRQTHQVPGGNASTFPKNYTVMRALSGGEGAVSVRKKDVIHCGKHKKRAVMFYCQQCRKVVCDWCRKGHKGHMFMKLKDKAAELSGTFEKRFEEVHCNVLSMQDRCEELREMKKRNTQYLRKQLEKNKKEVIEHIEKHYRALDGRIVDEAEKFEKDCETCHVKCNKILDDAKTSRKILEEAGDATVISREGEILGTVTQDITGKLVLPELSEFKIIHPQPNLDLSKLCDVLDSNNGNEMIQVPEITTDEELVSFSLSPNFENLSLNYPSPVDVNNGSRNEISSSYRSWNPEDPLHQGLFSPFGAYSLEPILPRRISLPKPRLIKIIAKNIMGNSLFQPVTNDVTITSEGMLSLVDWKNGKVRCYNTDGQQVDQVSISGAGYISNSNRPDEVLLSCTKSGIKSWNRLTNYTELLDLSLHDPRGVTHTLFEGRTVVAVIDEGDKIKLFDIYNDGYKSKEIKSFYIKSRPTLLSLFVSSVTLGLCGHGGQWIAGHPAHDRLVVSDNTVMTYYKSGEEQWSSDAKTVHRACGMEMLKDGSVIVADYGGQKVQHLSPEGALIKTLLTKYDIPGVKPESFFQPLAVAYNEDNNLLAVTEWMKPQVMLYRC